MEKELETAQLVQDNFFPMNYMVIGDIEVAAYFKPASECGGDWWGSIELGNELVILIGDATGHGVPAALITAAAHSCTTTLAWLAQKQKNIVLSPTSIMENLNAAVYFAGRGKVKMTFFVAMINLSTGAVRYANAAHDMPLVYHEPPGPAGENRQSNDQFEALLGKPDFCLGQDIGNKFREHVFSLDAGDSLLFFTDGLLECKNPDQEEYGERRLLRCLRAGSCQSATEMRDQLLQNALDFYAGAPQDDDITVVVVKRNRKTCAERIAS
jgi:phosphoserine phosphatase RsbU/P